MVDLSADPEKKPQLTCFASSPVLYGGHLSFAKTSAAGQAVDLSAVVALCRLRYWRMSAPRSR